MDYPVSDYGVVWEMLRGTRLKDRVQYPGGYLMKNTVRQICLYDKRAEMRGRGADVSNVPANVLRCEVRAVDGRTVRRGLELETVSDLVKNFDRVPEMYRTVVRSLFKHEAVHLQSQVENRAARIFAAEKSRGGRYWKIRAVAICGAPDLCATLGEDGLRRVLRSIGLSKQNIYQTLGTILELRDSGLEQSATLFGERLTVGQLYDELRLKLAA
jgi:hypothetical protein